MDDQNYSKKQKVVYQLIALAKQDFTASKFAEDIGAFNIALYHLQQSSEKIVKAYWLHSEFIEATNRSLLQLRHEPHELVTPEFEKKVLSVLNNQTTRLLRAGIPGTFLLTPLLKKMKAQATSYIPKDVKQIKSLSINQTDSEIRKMIADTWDLVRNLEDAISQAMESNVTIRLAKAVSKKAAYRTAELGIWGIRAWVFSMLSSIILAPHEARTRYPFPDENQEPITYYSLAHPLVSCYGQLSEVVGEAILATQVITNLYKS